MFEGFGRYEWEQAVIELDSAVRPFGYSCWSGFPPLEWNMTFESKNITDAFVSAEDGAQALHIRSHSWNTKFFKVPESDVSLQTGDCGSCRRLHSITLRQFLKCATQFGAAYTGLNTSTDLSCESVDNVKIRFETVFLPVKNGDDGSAEVQFVVQTFSDYVQSEKYPHNLILLATKAGISVHADSSELKQIMMHDRSSNEANEYWPKAERSKPNEKKTSLPGLFGSGFGKAKSEESGMKAMETRSNVVKVIQVPLTASSWFAGSGFGTAVPPRLCHACVALPIEKTSGNTEHTSDNCRVSRGERRGDYCGLSKTWGVYRSAEPVLVTCLLIKTVVGIIPSLKDVFAAVADMESLYKSGNGSELSGLSVGSCASNNLPLCYVTEVVTAKFRGLENMDLLSEGGKKAVFELNLLAFGAVRSASVKAALEDKFDALNSSISSSDNSGARQLLVELELLITGSLELLKRDAQN